MNNWQYEETIEFLDDWAKEEGLCRFCQNGRCCPWSRRGRQDCDGYRFAHEMDCFHLWIAYFDKGCVFREGYDYPDDYPWKDEPPERDIPLFPKQDDELAKKNALLNWLKRKRQKLLQKIDDIVAGVSVQHLGEQLDVIEKRIEQLTKKRN